jgi:DDE domain
MFSEYRDMAAVKAFFESAKMVTGVTPDRVTTDGHDSYPRAIRTTLGAGVRHRDSQYLNNRLEQDHRGVKGRYGPMRGFKCPRSDGDFCRAYDELRNFLRSRSRTNQQVSANYRRFHFLRHTAMVLSVLAPKQSHPPSSQLILAGTSADRTSSSGAGTLVIIVSAPVGRAFNQVFSVAPQRNGPQQNRGNVPVKS